MLNTLAKLSRFGFNRHSLTLQDFYAICESEQITVLFEDIASSFYMEVDNCRFIVLSDRLAAFQLLYTAFHELGHALLGERNTTRACFFGLEQSPDEEMANDFATIALMPLRTVCNTEAFIKSNGACPLAERMHRRRVWLLENRGI